MTHQHDHCAVASTTLGIGEGLQFFHQQGVVGRIVSCGPGKTSTVDTWCAIEGVNLDAGIDPSQDTLPKRILNEAIPDGPSKGQKSKLGEILGQYYSDRGWTAEGIPTPEKLAALGLA